jgi:hypothetical protein
MKHKKLEREYEQDLLGVRIQKQRKLPTDILSKLRNYDQETSTSIANYQANKLQESYDEFEFSYNDENSAYSNMMNDKEDFYNMCDPTTLEFKILTIVHLQQQTSLEWDAWMKQQKFLKVDLQTYNKYLLNESLNGINFARRRKRFK